MNVSVTVTDMYQALYKVKNNNNKYLSKKGDILIFRIEKSEWEAAEVRYPD